MEEATGFQHPASGSSLPIPATAMSASTNASAVVPNAAGQQLGSQQTVPAVPTQRKRSAKPKKPKKTAEEKEAEKVEKEHNQGITEQWPGIIIMMLISRWEELWLEKDKGNFAARHWQRLTDSLKGDVASKADDPDSSEEDRQLCTGPEFTVDQVRSKVGELKKQHAKERSKENATGSVISNWRFFDVLDAFLRNSPKQGVIPGAIDGGRRIPQRTRVTDEGLQELSESEEEEGGKAATAEGTQSAPGPSKLPIKRKSSAAGGVFIGLSGGPSSVEKEAPSNTHATGNPVARSAGEEAEETLQNVGSGVGEGEQSAAKRATISEPGSLGGKSSQKKRTSSESGTAEDAGRKGEGSGGKRKESGKKPPEEDDLVELSPATASLKLPGLNNAKKVKGRKENGPRNKGSTSGGASGGSNEKLVKGMWTDLLNHATQTRLAHQVMEREKMDLMRELFQLPRATPAVAVGEGGGPHGFSGTGPAGGGGGNGASTAGAPGPGAQAGRRGSALDVDARANREDIEIDEEEQANEANVGDEKE